MLYRQRREMQPGKVQAIGRQCVQLQEGMRGVRDGGEIRPDLLVENRRTRNVDD